jgi:peptidoglycan/xylan/chitin deacetylase (PgdA/CDA1 family)
VSIFLSILSLLIILIILSYVVWKIKWGYPKDKLPGVLTYHKIARFELGGTWMPPGRFAAHIDYLLDSGYSFIGESEFLRVLDGERPPGSKEILLTFDDGYRDLALNAAPVLRDRGIPALIFIVTSYIGRDNDWELRLPWRRSRHLDVDEMKILSDSQFSFGSHTMTHRDLTKLAAEELKEELAGSREYLCSMLGADIKTLSYPFGRADRRVREAAEKAGYSAAFSICPPAGDPRVERFMLRREGVYIIDGRFSVKSKLERRGMFWIEDIKGRAINGVAFLTPLLKRSR